MRFQSTRPLRGATSSSKSPRRAARFQSTRPLRGATGLAAAVGTIPTGFNPRAPCGARRSRCSRPTRTTTSFNPRAPCGARQGANSLKHLTQPFQSTRPLRGATRDTDGQAMMDCEFQSTRPLRGATFKPCKCVTFKSVSIHAPLAGRDQEHAERQGCLEVSIHAPLAGRDTPQS